MKDYVVFTDGAYSSSRKQGGSAFIILKDGKRILEWSHTWKGGTNNTAEILAIYFSLRFFNFFLFRIDTCLRKEKLLIP